MNKKEVIRYMAENLGVNKVRRASWAPEKYLYMDEEGMIRDSATNIWRFLYSAEDWEIYPQYSKEYKEKTIRTYNPFKVGDWVISGTTFAEITELALSMHRIWLKDVRNNTFYNEPSNLSHAGHMTAEEFNKRYKFKNSLELTKEKMLRLKTDYTWNNNSHDIDTFQHISDANNCAFCREFIYDHCYGCMLPHSSSAKKIVCALWDRQKEAWESRDREAFNKATDEIIKICEDEITLRDCKWPNLVKMLKENKKDITFKKSHVELKKVLNALGCDLNDLDNCFARNEAISVSNKKIYCGQPIGFHCYDLENDCIQEEYFSIGDCVRYGGRNLLIMEKSKGEVQLVDNDGKIRSHIIRTNNVYMIRKQEMDLALGINFKKIPGKFVYREERTHSTRAC